MALRIGSESCFSSLAPLQNLQDAQASFYGPKEFMHSFSVTFGQIVPADIESYMESKRALNQVLSEADC